MPNNDNISTSSGSGDASSEQVNLQDLVLDLNFVPTWARKPSDGENPYAQRESSGEGQGRERRPRREQRSGGGNRPATQGRAPDRRDGGGHRDRKPRDARQPADASRRRPPFEERIHLPIEVSFIPDRDRLGAIVRQLHTVKRAFPLTYISGLFLSKPEYHMIKLEAKPVRGGEPIQFFQCRESKVVFLNREGLVDYLVRTHLSKHFERVETTVEPPTGSFVCVGQCKRTGIILGPPNYHGYNERLLEVYRNHCSSMSLDQYRNNIEMIRDPAVIEKWKDECRTQVKYRPREAAPDAEAVLTLSQVESIFMEKYAAGYIQSGTKVIMPASAVSKIEDDRLLQHLQGAWLREDRFPFSLMLALRPAFRRMRLNLFKAGKDETFVTAIPPKPLDAEHAIPSIKEMVAIICEHPGWNRKQLVEKLYPGKSPDDPEVVEKMSSLVWLVEKGHIIEFFNGTYAVPGHLRKPGAIPAESPQEHHHPEVPAPEVTTVVSESNVGEETLADADLAGSETPAADQPPSA